MAELYFRSLDRRRRDTGLDYADTWREGGIGPGGYLKENFIGKVADGYGGKVDWINNSSGFRSKTEFSRNKKPGVLRILSLGDSFTAGYRVGQGKTYSDLLHDGLEGLGISNEVLISCIEHPYKGLEYLKKYGHEWNPDVVLLGVTLGNDIAQDYVALDPQIIGFQNDLKMYDLPDYCFSHKENYLSSVIEFLQHSRFLRRLMPKPRYSVAWYGSDLKPKMFDACHGLGFYIRNTPEIIEEAYRRHLGVIESFQKYCKKSDIVFAVLIFPQRFQVQPEDWEATVRHYRLEKEAFDLDLPNRTIRTFCESMGIRLVDPTESMKEAHAKHKIDMYLPSGDMHWNENGHYWWFTCAKGDLYNLICP